MPILETIIGVILIGALFLLARSRASLKRASGSYVAKELVEGAIANWETDDLLKRVDDHPGLPGRTSLLLTAAIDISAFILASETTPTRIQRPVLQNIAQHMGRLFLRVFESRFSSDGLDSIDERLNDLVRALVENSLKGDSAENIGPLLLQGIGKEQDPTLGALLGRLHTKSIIRSKEFLHSIEHIDIEVD